MAEDASVETTKMSSRGQIVIPQGIREDLGLRSGDSFAVRKEEGRIVLTPLRQELLAELEDMWAMSRRRAKILKLKKISSVEAVRQVREERRRAK